jgi:hypothetical protein
MYFELSFTRRKSLACPYYFQRLYATGETQASQLDATAGILGHELIADYILHLQSRHRQRDTEWLVARFNKEMEGKHRYIVDFLEEPIAKFMGVYTRRRDVQIFVEQELWCTVDGKPLTWIGENGETLQVPTEGTQLTCDCYHGRADLIEVEYDGEKATVMDHKLGWDRSYLGLDCQRNEQIMGYCWTWLVHHPECETIVGAICPWRWTTLPIYGSWSRDHLMNLMPELIGNDMAKVRAYYEERGTEPWPAKPDYQKVCRWCGISCPLYGGE